MVHVTVNYEMFLPGGHHRQPRNVNVKLDLDGTGGGDYLPGGPCTPNFFPQLPYTLGMGTGMAQLIFWSVTDGVSGQVLPPDAFTQTVGTVPMAITGWYYPISGPGVYGDGSAIIDDAFSANEGRFIDDTFVDVTSDPSLTSDANVIGVVPTSSAETLVAKNSVVSTSEPFFKWILNGSFGNVGNTTLQVPQGTNGMAVAVYQNHQSRVSRPPYEAAYDPWWWIKSWWGHGPDPAPDSIRQFGVVMELVDAASRIAPQARGPVLEAALHQLRVVAANLEKEIKGQQQKQG